MDKELADGVWKKKLIRHVGTAKSDLDLAVLMQKANPSFALQASLPSSATIGVNNSGTTTEQLSSLSL